MPKKGNTIRMPGKHHSVPVCFVPLLNDLESHISIERVGISNWRKMGNVRDDNLHLKVKYYDGTTRGLKIEAKCIGYVQNLILEVTPENRGAVEEYLSSYSAR